MENIKNLLEKSILYDYIFNVRALIILIIIIIIAVITPKKPSNFIDISKIKGFIKKDD